jgi:hypothetical protein
VVSTFVLLAAALAGAALAAWWPLRLVLSVLAGLLMVRAFITYHDCMHGAILARSRLAWLLFRLYAALALTPPRSWKKSHNYHHGHVGQISTASIGAFPIMTTRMWREAAPAARARYRMERHPLTVLTGYVTLFARTARYRRLLSVQPLGRRPPARGLVSRGRATGSVGPGGKRSRWVMLTATGAADGGHRAREIGLVRST